MTVVDVPARPTESDLRERRSRVTAELLAEAANATGEHRKQLLDQVVVENMRVARAIAARYRGRGVALEDLEQVAHAALVRCVHKFNSKSADDLLSYAVPSIRGEVRRYFRDHGWMVRPPRRVQEIQSQVIATRDTLSEDGKAPDFASIAAALDVPVDDVRDALRAQGCFQPVSLDKPVGEDGGSVLGDLLAGGAADDNDDFDSAEARVVLRPALRDLTERERRLIHLRFVEGLTQTEIAAELGVTQTQVSRLLSKLLATLRERIGQLDSEPAAAMAA